VFLHVLIGVEKALGIEKHGGIRWILYGEFIGYEDFTVTILGILGSSSMFKPVGKWKKQHPKSD
jgi:hypothetical protein